MRRSRIRAAVAQVILATAFSSSASAAAIDDLGWLSGCWHSEGEKRQITEHWLKPTGGNMLGVSHTVVDGKTREFEFMRIMQDDGGDIFFVASPSGQKEARFKLVLVTTTEARFENPSHDFPQRIIYRRDGNSLVGRIEGTADGKERAVEFPLKRLPCDQ